VTAHKKAPWRAKREDAPPRGWARQSEPDEYEALVKACIADLVDVREPFVLISQIQRSGGTLLTQLFDGHPECHVHPGELEIGYPRKSIWPVLPLDDGPDRCFDVLYEEKSHKWLRDMLNGRGTRIDDDRPRYFLPRLQKAIYDRCVAAWSADTPRAVFDAFFTSYFNAWLGNLNLRTGPKRAVVAFGPRMHVEGLEAFFTAYPEGTLLTIVRDPRSWYASARTHKPRYAELEPALEHWRTSTRAALDAVERRPEQVVLLTFDQLVRETERTMGKLAGRVGISMDPVLLEQSSNQRGRTANTSHRPQAAGILADRTDLYREILDEETIRRIEELAGDLYSHAAELAGVG
jgi:hypothetical protein